ncbi:putative membrane protein [Rhodococcus sp. OK519]|uniref:YidH family protein n=1 Tax=Rhodococcus sp. OK519 TaxID=2135729 RepID=UPI000D39F5F1|nr:putative membrane protein [Rhodococcus sp. OK519]
MTLRGWRPKAFREGDDPDPRFTLANERTYLAWIRTGLGLIAAAVGLEAFGTDVVGPAMHTVLVVGLLVGAILLVGFAFLRWMGVEAAMRKGRSLPVPAIAAFLACLIAAAGVTLLIVVVR